MSGAAGPHEPAQPTSSDDDGSERQFEAAGAHWIAKRAGKGACGTGAYGLGLVEAIHFFDANAPDRPLREALLAHGRFAGLYDRELAELLETATPIVLPEGR